VITRESIAKELKGGSGFAAIGGEAMRLVVGQKALSEWPAFVESWNHLAIDQHMADGGRFRRRRYGRFEVERGDVARKPHGPHFQDVAYNGLNGGIDRWFEPITETIGRHPVLTRLIEQCGEVFAAASKTLARRFDVEAHQFRIEPTPNEIGKPTPEGMHRDGVDWAFVTLVARTGVAGGVTAIGDAEGRALGSFTLSEPLDSVFLDDRRVRHGVTPIQILDRDRPAYRDVLVLTFRRAE